MGPHEKAVPITLAPMPIEQDADEPRAGHANPAARKPCAEVPQMPRCPMRQTATESSRAHDKAAPYALANSGTEQTTRRLPHTDTLTPMPSAPDGRMPQSRPYDKAEGVHAESTDTLSP
jgi:hypothetical protein